MAREVVGKARSAPTLPARAVVVEDRSARPREAALETSALKRKLADPRALVVTAEVEPPKGIDASVAVDGARTLRALGVDAINITDNPMARLRMSSIAVAHLIRTETGAETIFHFSPRDRNVLGIQSDLLGAAGLGIKALLVVGGDPLKIGDYPQAKSVGEVDTLGLLRIVRGLNGGTDLAGGAIGSATSFAIACAANPAAKDLDVEISKLSAKIEAGATFAQTQPVYDVAALDRFYARAEAHAIPILIGLIPPKSLKQALYFANEVPGMVVPEIADRADAQGGRQGPRVRGRGRARDRRRARARDRRAGTRRPHHADGALRRREADPRGARDGGEALMSEAPANAASSAEARLRALLRERIAVLDGAMGTHDPGARRWTRRTTAARDSRITRGT